ncbi:MAG TPA: hypothetical protein VK191_03060 [Symbiobacteriaceae bacterium]|nr:hypothetical protein [Symbiobacteriaceae bacterium]
MFARTLLSVPGGSTQTLVARRFTAMQAVVGEVGADKAPLFLRLGRAGGSRHQPVSVATLLKEMPHIQVLLGYFLITGAEFCDANGDLLGTIWGFGDGLVAGGAAASTGGGSGKGIGARRGAKAGQGLATLSPTLHAMPEGLALTVAELPPPVGFRSEPGLEPGHFRCYFRELQITPEGWLGYRTEEMGGSGQPVKVPAVALPSVTRWDASRTAGNPQVTLIRFVERQAVDVFADELHALEAAGNECLRLKRPLHVTHD